MTLVIDSNVLLSALAGHPGSPSAKLLTGIRAGSVQAVDCQRLITELREGLRKPYFAERVSEREAEEAVAAGWGVCQDHAHIFIAAARSLDIPARYVSGYLMMNDRINQEATHAWAEAYVQNLGWVGFDVANAMCPDDRYVRVATGLDYGEAAPVSGTRRRAGAERLAVTVEVAAQ